MAAFVFINSILNATQIAHMKRKLLLLVLQKFVSNFMKHSQYGNFIISLP